jgi:hypothetical protein
MNCKRIDRMKTAAIALGMLVLWPVCAARAVDISFTLDKPGRVSLAVYNREGHLLRSLLYGKQLPVGDHRMAWDGLDAGGRAVPAGEYEWRLLRNEGLQAEYLVSVGANPGWAPYGMWVGSHGPVHSLAVDAAQNRLYIGALSGENCPVFQCISLDGKTLHWQSEQLSSFMGAQRLAVRGSRLYLLQNDGWLYDLDTAAAPNKNLVKRWDLIHPAETRIKPERGKLLLLPEGHQPDGLAVHEKFIAVSHPSQDSIRWHHQETKELLREEKLPGVHGLAVLENGTLIAAAGSQVYRIPFPAGKPEPLLNDDTLAAAFRVAVDEKRNELWVAEEETSHTIRRYQLSTGERTLLLGSKDGRPFGKFDPLHWRDLTDIACDGQGGVITVEITPRRVAHFAIENDKPRLINQWFGGQQWGNMTAVDPADPTIAYVNASSFHRARVRMDFAKRTWEMEAVYDTPAWIARREGKSYEDAPFPSITRTDAQWQVIHRGKESYLVSLGGNSMTHAPAVIRVDTEKHRLVPVACAGMVRAEPDGRWPTWFARLKNDLLKSGDRNPPLWIGYTWSDRNGDGELQDSEFRIATAPDMPSLGHGSIDANWNVTMPASTRTGVADQPVGLILKNLAEDADAAPQWDWAQVEPTIEKLPTEFASLGSASVVALHRDETGSLTILVRANTKPSDDRQGNAWPGNTVGTARIVRFNPQGDWLWSAGKHGAVNDIAAGEFQYPKRVMGTGHGCIFIQDRAVRIAQAWTTDGLYAGNFLDRHADDGFPVEQVYRAPLASHGVENFLFDQIGGSVVTAANGDILWNPVGRNSSPVYRINGWDGWERQSGRIHLDQPATVARKEGTGLRGSYFTNNQWTGAPAVIRTDAQLWFGNRQLAFAQDTSGRDWIGKQDQTIFDLKSFSARWEGRIESPLSEAYQFILEHDEGSTVRLWLDGQLMAESQAESARSGKALERQNRASTPQVPPQPQSVPQTEGTPKTRRGQRVKVPEQPPAKTLRIISKPVPLVAGSRHEIMIEYSSSGDGRPQMHLDWESFTQERQHVPTTALSMP